MQMERRARLRKIMATMDDEDERKAALPGKRWQVLALSHFVHSCTAFVSASPVSNAFHVIHAVY